MIYIVCTNCRTALCTHGDPDEVESLLGERSDYYPDKYPCCVCGAMGQYVRCIEPTALSSMAVHELTPQEVFAVLNGMGLPEEQECGPAAIQKVFHDSKVTKVHAKIIPGTNRSMLDSLEFEDGTRMYFGVSPTGPTIYRIARKRSFTREVLDDEG